MIEPENNQQSAAGEQPTEHFSSDDFVRELTADFHKSVASRSKARTDAEYRPWEAKAEEEAEGRRFVAEQSIEAADIENRSSEGWRSAKPALDRIKQTLPANVSLSYAADMVMEYEKLSRHDPELGAEFLVRELATWGQKGGEAKARPESKSLRDSLERSFEHAEDGEQLAEFRKAYGADIGQVLETLANVLPEAMRDPHAFAERQKYTYGAPRTEMEARERAQQVLSDGREAAEFEQAYQAEAVRFPQLADDSFREAVVKTLTSDWFKAQTSHVTHTGELLHIAAHMTTNELRAAEAKARQEQTTKKARLSITGAQDHADRAAARVPPKSAREALMRAFEGVSV